MFKDDVILQLYSRASAPSRDYYGLTITETEVILNIWNITHGPHVYPKKTRCSLDDLSICKLLLAEINRIFGASVMDYSLDLSNHSLKLQCLPNRAFLYILKNLATNDILHLGQSSKIFFELCNRNIVWKLLFGKRLKQGPSRDESRQGDLKGWKCVLRSKINWIERKNAFLPFRNQNLTSIKNETAVKTPKEAPKNNVVEINVSQLNNPKKVLRYEKSTPNLDQFYRREVNKEKANSKIFVSRNTADLKKRYSVTNEKPVKREMRSNSLEAENFYQCSTKLNSQSECQLRAMPKPVKGILKKKSAYDGKDLELILDKNSDREPVDYCSKFETLLKSMKEVDGFHEKPGNYPERLKPLNPFSTFEHLTKFIEGSKQTPEYNLNDIKLQMTKRKVPFDGKTQLKTFTSCGSESNQQSTKKLVNKKNSRKNI